MKLSRGRARPYDLRVDGEGLRGEGGGGKCARTSARPGVEPGGTPAPLTCRPGRLPALP